MARNIEVTPEEDSQGQSLDESKQQIYDNREPDPNDFLDADFSPDLCSSTRHKVNYGICEKLGGLRTKHLDFEEEQEKLQK